jgi:hypothetical protein
MIPVLESYCLPHARYSGEPDEDVGQPRDRLAVSAVRLATIKGAAPSAILLASISASRFAAAPVIPTLKQDRTSAASCFRAKVHRRRGALARMSVTSRACASFALRSAL